MHVKLLLKKYRITPKKSWSQYFLISQFVIHEMASYARGVVLEIGPGLGFITQELAKRAGKVITIEKDKKMVNILENEYTFDNVEIIKGDITEMDLPVFDRVISNIPYHISSQITFKLLEHEFELGVLSYQKEFAQRLVMPPSPQVSRLSVMAQMKADCELLRVISRKNFYPVPKTDCALVKLVPHPKIAADTFFDNVVTGLYSHKRKTVRNALLSSVDLTGVTRERLKTIQIPYTERRVWSLTLEEICTLVDVLRHEVVT
ncbi:MAG: ribosomal RNA small subunit methyltransferase A [Theionarchaea archaeon]|nr:ribosomal RNA small subunit methyltransferase A [Theionarchaea archaeon]